MVMDPFRLYNRGMLTTSNVSLAVGKKRGVSSFAGHPVGFWSIIILIRVACHVVCILVNIYLQDNFYRYTSSKTILAWKLVFIMDLLH